MNKEKIKSTISRLKSSIDDKNRNINLLKLQIKQERRLLKIYKVMLKEVIS